MTMVTTVTYIKLMIEINPEFRRKNDGRVELPKAWETDFMFAIHNMSDDSIYYVNYLGDPGRNSFDEVGYDKKSLQVKIEQIIAHISTLKKQK